MSLSKEKIAAHGEFLKKHFMGRGWFSVHEVHNSVGMSFRELAGIMRCANLHGIPGCTILHDKEVYPPRWIIIEGTAPEAIQRELERNKPKKIDWSFLRKPWPLWDLLNSLEDEYDSVRPGN